MEEGIKKLKLVLEALKDAGLTIRLEKCKFFMRRLEYLGFEISSGGIEPEKRKILAVENYPTPKNVRAVRGFISLVSFFRRFIKGFAVIARPITDLLSKNIPFIWKKEQEKSFEILKKTLINKPILAMYNPGGYTEVHTDASTQASRHSEYWQP